MSVLILPLFNQLTGTTITANVFEHFQNVLWLLLIAVVVGALSGSYPALVLSGLKPISSLKGKFDPAGSGLVLRKTLVITQFSISIFLVIATVVVYQQLDFMQNQQLGFDKQNKLVVDFQFDSRITQHAAAITQQLGAIPGVGFTSLSYSIPGTANNQYKTIIENSNEEQQEIRTDAYFISENFLKQYKIDLVAGKAFAAGASDTLHAMLINETMAYALGFSSPENAVGKQFFQLNQRGTIIGVVKDFHFHSFQEKVKPLTLRIDPGYFTFLNIDISSSNVRSTVSQIEAAWKNIAPGLPFVYFFADEAYNRQYIAQQRFGRLFICFASIAILISCLGLLGLSAFSTAQRKKEIGIRKVLGASVNDITFMLSKDFIKLVIFALVVISPLSWWLMNAWLQDFAYRISISPWVFLFSGLAAILIALFTVGFQAIKAATVNPVKSIRND